MCSVVCQQIKLKSNLLLKILEHLKIFCTYCEENNYHTDQKTLKKILNLIKQYFTVTFVNKMDKINDLYKELHQKYLNTIIINESTISYDYNIAYHKIFQSYDSFIYYIKQIIIKPIQEADIVQIRSQLNYTFMNLGNITLENFLWNNYSSFINNFQHCFIIKHITPKNIDDICLFLLKLYETHQHTIIQHEPDDNVKSLLNIYDNLKSEIISSSYYNTELLPIFLTKKELNNQ